MEVCQPETDHWIRRSRPPDDLQPWLREGKHQRILPSEPCVAWLQVASRQRLCLPVLPHLGSDLEGFSWPHCPYQPLIQPLSSQSTPANPERTIWTGVAASFSREMGPSRLGGWPGRVTGRVHVHVVMAMEKSNAMRVYQSCVSRAHGRYTSKKPPPGGFSFLTGTFLSGLYSTTVAQGVS